MAGYWAGWHEHICSMRPANNGWHSKGAEHLHSAGLQKRCTSNLAQNGLCSAASWAAAPIRARSRTVPAAISSTAHAEISQDNNESRQTASEGGHNKITSSASAKPLKASLNASWEGNGREQDGQEQKINELLTAWACKASSVKELEKMFRKNKVKVNEINVVAMLTQLSWLYEDGGDANNRQEV